MTSTPGRGSGWGQRVGGRFRRSTFVALVVFCAAFATYILVRPPQARPATGSNTGAVTPAGGRPSGGSASAETTRPATSTTSTPSSSTSTPSSSTSTTPSASTDATPTSSTTSPGQSGTPTSSTSSPVGGVSNTSSSVP